MKSTFKRSGSKLLAAFFSTLLLMMAGCIEPPQLVLQIKHGMCQQSSLRRLGVTKVPSLHNLDSIR